MFCFECNSIKCMSKDTSCKQRIKMNETVNKFLPAFACFSDALYFDMIKLK